MQGRESWNICLLGGTWERQFSLSSSTDHIFSSIKAELYILQAVTIFQYDTCLVLQETVLHLKETFPQRHGPSQTKMFEKVAETF